jgi:Ala-tRNA(Pro) deacylase
MRIPDYLQGRHVWFQAFLHVPVPTASRFAQAVHVPGRQVAKGVLVKAGESYVLVVLPATARIDLSRLSQVLDGAPVVLAAEDELERVFGDCERGALPPFGRPYGLRTVVDASLSGCSEIICAGNTRHEGVRLRYRDYEALEAPTRARFATAAGPKRRRASHRRAG